MKIVHLADIHIRKSPQRHNEFKQVFQNLYKSLIIKKPDRIVLVGDLLHDKLNMQGEMIVLASEFLNNLTKIAPVRITMGNHDFQSSASKRIDAVGAIITVLKNPNIIYYNQTGFYEDGDVVWAVWHHGEKNNNPWTKVKNYQRIVGKTYIDLFHDPIQGAKNETGYEFNSKTYRSIKDFKGDFSFFGDCHKKQYL